MIRNRLVTTFPIAGGKSRCLPFAFDATASTKISLPQERIAQPAPMTTNQVATLIRSQRERAGADVFSDAQASAWPSASAQQDAG